MKTRTLMALGVVLGTSVLGYAEDEPQKDRRPQGPPPAHLVKEFDKDGDGKLSKEEAKTMRLALRERMEARRKEMLERFDADKDGKLSDAERENARATVKAEMLEKYDTDGDGKLSEAERAAMPKPPMKPGGPKGKRGPEAPDGPPDAGAE